ncbi:indolepyruvate ferredoxin oxidoreductase subunit alpha [Desulfonispora thiosulfatigenes]|nr:indolepyruvate ferredoxin oxidoreductase subunit alpha [Desulfonispora thiosulfatigenes]
MKNLLTGNEAIARGAWEAGVNVVTAYPGTPSTEITKNAACYEEIYAEWSPNEKVALEVGIGASIAGARVLVAMKHVGVNVAADPLLTFAYTGVNGGLVLVSADDPGMHSSQNEQDNRYYGKMAKIPILEPANSQEAKDYTKLAFEISEKFDTPVILRITTRVAHSQSLVELSERTNVDLKEYVKNPAKYIMTPANARNRHVYVEDRLLKLKEYNETNAINKIEWASKKIGIITSGISYQYIKEVLKDVSIMKIGMSFPLPTDLITDFASQVEEVYVIEELEPFIEDSLKVLGIKVIGKEVFSNIGEIHAETIAEKILDQKPEHLESDDIPVRPPVLCPGCPHRGVFYVLNKLKVVVTGDIGCYTLGSAPPLSSMDTTICMGASIGTALGMEKARGKEFAQNLVAVIGDSTFIHSGITGLIDVVYNKGTTTTLILDNRITGMTGHQHNPVSGFTIKGEPTKEVNLELLVKAVGIERVVTIDPFDLKGLEETLKSELKIDEPSVIICRRPCALIEKKKDVKPLKVNLDECIGCKMCLKLGCPGIVKVDDKVRINPTQCNGCGLCATVCPKGAIKGDN